jgi:hypothetical protein
MRIRIAHLGTVAALLAGILVSAPVVTADQASNPAGEAHPGDLWETTSQMSMPGMPMAMPSHAMKVCARRGATQPPMGSDPNQKCENSNFQRSGSTVTWTSTCKNPPMTGAGQITYDNPDAYSGTITFNSEGHVMTIKLTGKKTGTCDKPLD